MTLPELLVDLEEANKRLKAAEKMEQEVRMYCTQARNEVNHIQKSIDAEMKKLKESAAWNTDWQSERACKGRISITSETT